MCGFLGYTYFDAAQAGKARAALNTIAHRGPDQWGEYIDGRVYLGHRRLSIIDLSERGRQPMTDPGGEVAVVYNGEIYNFPDLKKELSDEINFTSGTDTEVLLHGYRKWGLEVLLDRIDGMYAFCIYDRRSGKIYLATDRYGKKPVFYAENSSGMIFSSEIKAIFELDGGTRAFSYEGIKRWMYFRGSNSRTTIYRNIYKVPPGTYLEIGGSVEREHRYYDVLDAVRIREGDSEPDEFEEIMTAAVSKRLISDVPVGLQLSGGVDSSLVGHYLRNTHQGEMHSFSIGFGEEKFKRFSEEKYARYAAERLGFTHHQCNMDSGTAAEAFERLVYFFDGMLDYPNSIPIYLLCRYARDYVTVLLTGEGADELLGGYGKFIRIHDLEKPVPLMRIFPRAAISLYSRFNAGVSRAAFLKKYYSGRPDRIFRDMNSFISHDSFSRIFGKMDYNLLDEVDIDKFRRMPFFRQLIVMDHKTYLYSQLERQDRASMGASMESRLPFLDRKLVEWAVNLRKEHLFDNGRNKILLKDKAAGIFGEDFAYRTKQGFPMPLKFWLRPDGEMFPAYRKIFSGDFLLSEKIDMKSVESYVEGTGFDRKLLNYGDSDRIWIKWYLMVLRTAQDVMKITDIS